MKRFAFLVFFLVGAALFVIGCTHENNASLITTELYFVDAELNRLIPYTVEITDGSSEDMAQEALGLLVMGRDGNDKIRRILPNDEKCVSVRVEDDIAYINLKSDADRLVPDSRDFEKLFIYQLINTMTEIRGIRFVRFTIDGSYQKDFLGYFDMRETYKFQYPE